MRGMHVLETLGPTEASHEPFVGFSRASFEPHMATSWSLIEMCFGAHTCHLGSLWVYSGLVLRPHMALIWVLCRTPIGLTLCVFHVASDPPPLASPPQTHIARGMHVITGPRDLTNQSMWPDLGAVGVLPTAAPAAVPATPATDSQMVATNAKATPVQAWHVGHVVVVSMARVYLCILLNLRWFAGSSPNIKRHMAPSAAFAGDLERTCPSRIEAIPEAERR